MKVVAGDPPPAPGMLVQTHRVKVALFVISMVVTASYLTYYRVSRHVLNYVPAAVPTLPEVTVTEVKDVAAVNEVAAVIGVTAVNKVAEVLEVTQSASNHSATARTSSPPVIPNVVHYVRFDQPELRFVELVCILSAYINLRPERIMIHTNTVPSSGDYWRILKERVGPVLTFHEVDRPTEIFGRKVAVVQHASDVVRIRMLLQYGGIYLDNDVYVVRGFDEYRNRSKCSIGWPMDVDKKAYIGNQIFVCPPNDHFLQAYLETYRSKFDDGKWYYNAGQVPSEDLLHMNYSTTLIHAVPDAQFAVNTGHIGRIFLFGARRDHRWSWRSYRAIHLLYQHRQYMVKEEWARYGAQHDPTEIRNMDSAFGEMARLVYYGAEDMLT